MPLIKVTCNKETKSFKKPVSGLEVAQSFNLHKKAVCFLMNKKVYDLRELLKEDSKISFLTNKDTQSLEVLRHSAAHVLAEACQSLFPEVKVGIGPVIEDGFYYDFKTKEAFSEDDLEKIEKKANEIIQKDIPVRKELMSRKKAIKLFKSKKEDLKVKIIESLEEEELSIYHQGDWFDLCKGPHVQNLSQIPLIKVLSVAGAYFKGDERNEQLQRIYATCFLSEKDLKAYLKRLEEAKKNDHRVLGKKLNLFYFSEFSPGSPFFTEKGSYVYRSLQNFIREKYFKYNYSEVISPQLFDTELYKKSGHYDNYKDNMYFTQKDESFSFKPMNCPGHCLLFAMKNKSYKELPYRIADFGRLHRQEKTGTMHGLNRVRSFCQDDAHVFCTIDQIKEELKHHLLFLDEVYEELKMKNYRIELATRPLKSLGSDEIWEKSEKLLKEALEEMKLPYELKKGEGAFYGPKIDFIFKDELKRDWQLGTFQCDFNLPERFNLKYKAEDNKMHRPVLLHRAILGSLERFMGVYLEHIKGKFPLWLAPTQLSILNISEHQKDYASQVFSFFKEHSLRAHLDDRDEKLNLKIRQAQLEYIPYMIIIGDKEKDQNRISVRFPNGKTRYELKKEDFLESIKKQIENKE